MDDHAKDEDDMDKEENDNRSINVDDLENAHKATKISKQFPDKEET